MSSLNYQPFPNTHWSLVHRAGISDAAARRDALTVLLTRYQPALHSYLRVVRKMDADAAGELLQAFIADQLLAGELLRRADASRGRFRSLLLTSLNNFAISRSRAARLRDAAPLDTDPASPATSPHLAVEAAWARALVHQVIEAMRLECRHTNRPDVWAVFEGRILADIFGTGPVTSYETLATDLKLQSPTQAANLLVTAKRTYARLLRLAVAEYETDPENIDAEIADLRQLLSTDVPA